MRSTLHKGIVAGTAIVAAGLAIGAALVAVFAFRDAMTARLMEWQAQPEPEVVVAVEPDAGDLQGAVEQSIRVIERRFYDLAMRVTVAQDGPDRILLRLGRSDHADKLIALATRRGRLEFRLIDPTMTGDQALAAKAPPTSEVLLDTHDMPHLVAKEAFVSGRDLDAVHAAFSVHGEPVVRLTLSRDGARRLGEVTQANVGRALAIVFDGKVLSAPVIRSPIPGGAAEIAGSFTVEAATEMAALLGGGELPARLTVVEQRAPKQR